MDTATDNTPNTENAPAPSVFTWEANWAGESTDLAVAHTFLTRSAPGSTGPVVGRVKRRGRPSYFLVVAEVPADAKPFKGEVHTKVSELFGQ